MKPLRQTFLPVAALATGLTAAAADAAPTASATKPAGAPLAEPRHPDGKGGAAITGERKQWHKATFALDGPFAHGLDSEPNPFTDCNLTVTFTHESGEPRYSVPGYFAADGNAGNSSAEAGTKWRAHLGRRVRRSRRSPRRCDRRLVGRHPPVSYTYFLVDRDR
jgi:hypothetical protein